MPNTFKNASVAVGVTDTDVYTCPVATSAVVFSSYIANTNGAEIVNVTVKVFDDSGAVLRTITGTNTPINIGATLTLDKIALEANDVLRVVCDTAASLDMFISILEIT